MKNKISIHFTIDKEINDKLSKIVKTKCLNKSLLIQKLIEDYLESEKIKEKGDF